MKVVVLGATGFIGRLLTPKIEARGHQVVAASRRIGVDVTTGQGLLEAFKGADAVIDVTNSPTLEGEPSQAFFRTTTGHITAAAKAAGVGHLVALSIVGTDLVPDFGYYRAKVIQEDMIKSSGVPFTIVRATQFSEFVPEIAKSGAQDDGTVRLSTRPFQPVTAGDLTDTLAQVVTGAARNTTLDVAGPEPIPIYKSAQLYFKAKGEQKTVTGDESASWFGFKLNGNELLPGKDAIIKTTTLEQWLETVS